MSKAAYLITPMAAQSTPLNGYLELLTKCPMEQLQHMAETPSKLIEFIGYKEELTESIMIQLTMLLCSAMTLKYASDRQVSNHIEPSPGSLMGTKIANSEGEKPCDSSPDHTKYVLQQYVDTLVCFKTVPEGFNFRLWMAGLGSSLKQANYLLDYHIEPLTGVPSVTVHPLLNGEQELQLVTMLRKQLIPSDIFTVKKWRTRVLRVRPLATIQDFVTVVYNMTTPNQEDIRVWMSTIASTFLDPLLKAQTLSLTDIRKSILRTPWNLLGLPSEFLLILIQAT